MVKPFSGEHLAARVAALLRRAGQESAPTPVIAVAGLSVDLARREALLDGRRLELRAASSTCSPTWPRGRARWYPAGSC